MPDIRFGPREPPIDINLLAHKVREELAMIKPTVGRVVWFYPSETDPDRHASFDLAVRTGQPLAAHVAYVWSDRMVNLLVIDPQGSTHSRTSVPLIQDGDHKPLAGDAYCEWMPYQKGQAAKTEELEKKLSSDA